MLIYNPYVISRVLKVPAIVDTTIQYRGTKRPKRERAITEDRAVSCDFVDAGHDYPTMPITGYLAGPNTAQGIDARDVLVDMLNRGKFTHLVVDWGDVKTEWAVKDIPHQDVHAPCGHPEHWLLRFNKL